MMERKRRALVGPVGGIVLLFALASMPKAARATPPPLPTAYNLSESTQSTTSTGPQNGVVLTFTSGASQYLIIETATFAASDTYALHTSPAYTQVQAVVDDVVYSKSNQYSNLGVSGTAGQPFTTWMSFAAHQLVTFTAGSSHTIKIQYSTTNSSYAAQIRNARIVAIPVSTSQNVEQTPLETATDVNTPNCCTYGTGTTVKTLTFTPPSTEDYLVLASAQIATNPSQNGCDYLSMIRLRQGTTDEVPVDPKEEMRYQPRPVGQVYRSYANMRKYSLAGGAPQTFRIQVDARSVTCNGITRRDTFIKDTRITAIPLSAMAGGAVGYAEVEAEASTTSSTLQTRVTGSVTVTPSQPYVVLGMSFLKNAARSGSNGRCYQANGHHDVGGAGAADVGYICNSTDEYPSFFDMRQVSWPDSLSHSSFISYDTEAGGTARIKNARVMMLPVGFCSGKPDGTPCPDGNTCNGAEICVTETCSPGTPPPNGATCDLDLNFCTADTCQDGGCVPGPVVVCVPSDGCHNSGTCDPGTGSCTNPVVPDGTVCFQNACISGQTCSSGICSGGTVDPLCPAEQPPYDTSQVLIGPSSPVRALTHRFTAWQRESTSLTVDFAPTVAAFEGLIYIFSVNATNDIGFQTYDDSTGTYSTWTEASPGSGVRTNVPLAATATATTLFLFAKQGLGGGGNIVYKTKGVGGSWSGWAFLPTGLTALSPSAAAASDSSVFVARQDGATGYVYYSQFDGSAWGPWTLPSGPAAIWTTTVAPTLAWDAAPGVARLILYSVNTSSTLETGGLYRAELDSSGTWTACGRVATISLRRPVAAVSFGNADTIVYVRQDFETDASGVYMRQSHGGSCPTAGKEVELNGSQLSSFGPSAASFQVNVGGTGRLFVAARDHATHGINANIATQLRLHAVKVSDSDGAKAASITQSQARDWTDDQAELYRPADLYLHLAENVDFTSVANTALNHACMCGAPVAADCSSTNCMSPVDGNAEALLHPGKITVLFRRGQETNPAGGGWSGGVNFVVMPGYGSSITSTCGHFNSGMLGHEIGHFLSLSHTFFGNDEKLTMPLAEDRLKARGYDLSASFNGDSLGDTNVDPGGTEFHHIVNACERSVDTIIVFHYQTRVRMRQLDRMCSVDADCPIGGFCLTGQCFVDFQIPRRCSGAGTGFCVANAMSYLDGDASEFSAEQIAAMYTAIP